MKRREEKFSKINMNKRDMTNELSVDNSINRWEDKKEINKGNV